MTEPVTEAMLQAAYRATGCPISEHGPGPSNREFFTDIYHPNHPRSKMMSDWQPIETMPKDDEGMCAAGTHVVVGWWFSLSPQTRWWEISDDVLTDCATHWMPLPAPPALAKASPDNVGVER